MSRLPVIPARRVDTLRAPFPDPLETGFISILEPLWGILIAHLALGEVVPLSMYIGGGFILMGAVVQQATTGEARAVAQTLMVLLLQRIKDRKTRLKQWGHLGTLAAAQIINNSLFLVISLNLFLKTSERQCLESIPDNSG